MSESIITVDLFNVNFYLFNPTLNLFAINITFNLAILICINVFQERIKIFVIFLTIIIIIWLFVNITSEDNN